MGLCRNLGAILNRNMSLGELVGGNCEIHVSFHSVEFLNLNPPVVDPSVTKRFHSFDFSKYNRCKALEWDAMTRLNHVKQIHMAGLESSEHNPG